MSDDFFGYGDNLDELLEALGGSMDLHIDYQKELAKIDDEAEELKFKLKQREILRQFKECNVDANFENLLKIFAARLKHVQSGIVKECVDAGIIKDKKTKSPLYKNMNKEK